MNQIIEHRGIIHKIANNHIQVLIIQQTACNECKANGVCFTTEEDKKIIEVDSSDSNFKVGDKVILSGDKSIGLLAVLLAFVIPFLLILVTLFILNSNYANEVISGAVSICVLVPYYLILSFFNMKLKTKFRFEITKENEEKYESEQSIR